MYSVIVVDDETWILKLIRKIVDWEALGFRVMADASDGKTALQLITEQRPDLVITDIRMPGIDGIGLIKATRELNIDSEFIIISGYSDFEYARCAVTYDAFGYLLKPLGKEEFKDVLRRVGERIGEKRKLQKKIEDSDTRMLENDIKQTISGQNRNVSINVLNAQYGTNFKDGLFCATIFKQDFSGRNSNNVYDNSQYLRFLAEMKEKYCAQFQEMVFFSGMTDDQVILIINTKSHEDTTIKRTLQNILAEYEERADFTGVFKLTICIGPRMEQFDAICESYGTASEAMKARAILGHGHVIDANEAAHRITRVSNIIALKDAKKLSQLFDVFDADGAASAIADIFSSAQQGYPGNAVICHLAAYEIVDVLLSSMGRKGMQSCEGVPTRQQAVFGIDSCVTEGQIARYLVQLLGEFAVIHAKERHDSGDQLISEIKAFVADNYMSDISLDDIARRVCLNPTYVSELFKKKTGENFSKHLTDFRIDIAKDLLKDVRYKIVDVSEKVGYKDSKYFSRLFKKRVGVNPTDYRKLYV